MRLHIAFTIAGACAIALIFVPFTANVVPLNDLLLDWDIWGNVLPMAAPCIVLPLPVCAGYTAWLVRGALPRWATVVGFTMSSSLAAGILIDIGWSEWNDLEEVSFVLLILIAFAAGGWISVRGVAKDSPTRGLIAMQCVYTVPMVYFLAASVGDYQAGAWLGLVAVSAYLAQIGLLLSRRCMILILLIPLVCLAMLTASAVGF